MPTTPASGWAARASATVLALEAIALAALVGWQVVALAGGDTTSLGTAIALAVLTAVGAAAVGAFAVAVWRDRSWGRSGGVVTQLLLLAVALGAATGSYAHPLTALALAVPGLAGLLVLTLAARDAARQGRDAA